MGLDVCMYADGEELSHESGATGWIVKPYDIIHLLPNNYEEPEEMDFIKATPEV